MINASLAIVDPQRADHWVEYIDCRVRNLYTPYGLPASCADNELDVPRNRQGVFHRAAILDGHVVGVGRIDMQPRRKAGPSAQLRYFAVDASTRGTGVGRTLMQAFEGLARESGADLLWMEARQEALGFYERCGYADIGEGPTKWGLIPHRILEKRLR
ncbi:MAG: GNAT family N-acetyltransferase [Phycisphaerales bacterium]